MIRLDNTILRIEPDILQPILVVKSIVYGILPPQYLFVITAVGAGTCYRGAVEASSISESHAGSESSSYGSQCQIRRTRDPR